MCASHADIIALGFSNAQMFVFRNVQANPVDDSRLQKRHDLPQPQNVAGARKIVNVKLGFCKGESEHAARNLATKSEHTARLSG